MSTPTPANGHHYTAAEIVQILERARALGVKFLKVEGFEATWGLEPLVEQKKPELELPTRQQPEGLRRAENLCPTCGAEKVMGKFGKPYCVSCFIEKKEGRR